MHHVLQGPSQTIQPAHDDHVALAQPIEQSAQLGLVTLAFGGHIFDELLAPSVLQRPPLRSQDGLVAFRLADIAERHEAIPIAAEVVGIPLATRHLAASRKRRRSSPQGAMP